MTVNIPSKDHGSTGAQNVPPVMRVFYIVPAWSDQAGQCRIVSREFSGKIDAAASYRETPKLWKEAGLMNSRGKLVYLDDRHAAAEMSQDEPLSAGMQYSFEVTAPADTLVEAAQFHSMRGHVADGTRVRFESGEILTVRSAMRGWNLVSDDSSISLGPFDGAMELTSAIVRRDNSQALDSVQSAFERPRG